MNNLTNTSSVLWKLRDKYPQYELSDVTLETAEKLVDKLYITARKQKLWWFPPRVGGDYYQVDLYWEHNRKRYDIFIEENEINYIAYWGNKTDAEREHGDINIKNDLTDFWEWIAE